MSMTKKLQVWWMPQVPCESFYVDVANVREGVNMLDALARYDRFQFENNIKPDYSNEGGLQQMGEDGEWEDWYLETDLGGYYDDPEDYIRMVDDGSLLDYLEMREGV